MIFLRETDVLQGEKKVEAHQDLENTWKAISTDKAKSTYSIVTDVLIQPRKIRSKTVKALPVGFTKR